MTLKSNVSIEATIDPRKSKNTDESIQENLRKRKSLELPSIPNDSRDKMYLSLQNRSGANGPLISLSLAPKFSISKWATWLANLQMGAVGEVEKKGL